LGKGLVEIKRVVVKRLMGGSPLFKEEEVGWGRRLWGLRDNFCLIFLSSF